MVLNRLLSLHLIKNLSLQRHVAGIQTWAAYSGLSQYYESPDQVAHVCKIVTKGFDPYFGAQASPNIYKSCINTPNHAQKFGLACMISGGMFYPEPKKGAKPYINNPINFSNKEKNLQNPVNVVQYIFTYFICRKKCCCCTTSWKCCGITTGAIILFIGLLIGGAAIFFKMK